MKYEVEDINSVGDLIDKLKGHINEFNGPVWFRGQVNTAWNLEPRLMRIDPHRISISAAVLVCKTCSFFPTISLP